MSSSARSSSWSQRPLPDPAREPVAVALLHDLEQLRLPPLVVELAGPVLHRAAPRVGLHASPAPTGTVPPAVLDDHVPDLAGGAAPGPALAVEDQAAADPRAPEDAEDRAIGLPGAELELGLGGDVDVVADPHLRPERLGQRRAQRKAALPSGEVAGLRDVPGLLVRVPGRADPDPGERIGLDAGGLGRLDQRLRHLGRDVGWPALGRGLTPGLAAHVSTGAHDRRLDLRPTQVDAPAQGILSRACMHRGRVYCAVGRISLCACASRSGAAILSGDFVSLRRGSSRPGRSPDAVGSPVVSSARAESIREAGPRDVKLSFRCCRAARRSARRSPRGSSAAPRARGRARRPAGSSARRARPAPRAGAARRA